MTNEEKILSLLEKHGEMLDRLDRRMDKLDERQTHTETLLEKHGELLERLDERQTKTEITLENVIVPHLDALAEGQKALMEALAPKSRVEALEEEVDLLKTVVRSLSRDVAELKKAQ
ncbi:hypothetical protein [Agathobaculum massiliense]|uniref:hypothetical protein n=1 Tax=Agathobaculum massiliense TaxID=3014267 RepID=UPI0036F415E2